MHWQTGASGSPQTEPFIPAPDRRHGATIGNLQGAATTALAVLRRRPFAAFPSLFLRIECNRCSKVAMLNEVCA
jgi:hypothetical protein